jgi:hypothetical protein
MHTEQVNRQWRPIPVRKGSPAKPSLNIIHQEMEWLALAVISDP